MPTMIQRYQCPDCDQQHATRHEAEQCLEMHYYIQGGDRNQVVLVLDLWECDAYGCQEEFPDQWAAQQCEAAHETPQDSPRPTDGSLFGAWMRAFTS